MEHITFCTVRFSKRRFIVDFLLRKKEKFKLLKYGYYEFACVFHSSILVFYNQTFGANNINTTVAPCISSMSSWVLKYHLNYLYFLFISQTYTCTHKCIFIIYLCQEFMTNFMGCIHIIINASYIFFIWHSQTYLLI